jgi:hypothetical protein
MESDYPLTESNVKVMRIGHTTLLWSVYRLMAMIIIKKLLQSQLNAPPGIGLFAIILLRMPEREFILETLMGEHLLSLV